MSDERARPWRLDRDTALLVAINAWGIALRWFVWFHAGGLYRKGGEIDIDEYLAMTRWFWSGDFQALASHRPTQPVYPLLLSPIYWFDLSPQIYVLALHTCFAVVLISCSFAIGRRLAGPRYGLLAAFLLASYQPTFSFFNWMFTDTVYYGALAAFILFALRCWEQRRTWPLAAAGAALFLVKPEAAAPLLVALAYGKSRRVLTVAAVALLLFVTLVFSVKTTRMALLSQFQVAQGLWLSTHTSLNMDGEVYRAYVAARELGEYRGYHGNAALAIKSLDIIREHPARYALNLPIRLAGVWYPGLFRSSASAMWRVKDMAICVFATVGALLCLVRERGPQRGVAMFGMAMTLVLVFFVNDGDSRLRVPVLIPMLLVAPLGWRALLSRKSSESRL